MCCKAELRHARNVGAAERRHRNCVSVVIFFDSEAFGAVEQFSEEILEGT